MIRLLSTFLFLIFLLSSIYSQDVKPGYISISPAHFFRNTFLVQFETGIAKDKTISIIPGVILKDNSFEKYKGFQIEIQPRFYLIHPSFETLDSKYGGARLQPYFAPYYGFLSLQKDYTLYTYPPNGGPSIPKDFERQTNAHSGGLVIGCRANLTKNLFLDVNAGGGFRFASIDDTVYDEDPLEYPIYEDYNIFDFDYSGITPKISFTLGIRLY